MISRLHNDNKRHWPCVDCGCHPWRRGEDFYVNNGLWKFVMRENATAIICIGCFEHRLGRPLVKRDIAKWFRKNRWWGDQRRKLNNPPSKRLREILGLGA